MYDGTQTLSTPTLKTQLVEASTIILTKRNNHVFSYRLGSGYWIPEEKIAAKSKKLRDQTRFDMEKNMFTTLCNECIRRIIPATLCPIAG